MADKFKNFIYNLITKSKYQNKPVKFFIDIINEYFTENIITIKELKETADSLQPIIDDELNNCSSCARIIGNWIDIDILAIRISEDTSVYSQYVIKNQIFDKIKYFIESKELVIDKRLENDIVIKKITHMIESMYESNLAGILQQLKINIDNMIATKIVENENKRYYAYNVIVKDTDIHDEAIKIDIPNILKFDLKSVVKSFSDSDIVKERLLDDTDIRYLSQE